MVGIPSQAVSDMLGKPPKTVPAEYAFSSSLAPFGNALSGCSGCIGISLKPALAVFGTLSQAISSLEVTPSLAAQAALGRSMKAALAMLVHHFRLLQLAWACPLPRLLPLFLGLIIPLPRWRHHFPGGVGKKSSLGNTVLGNPAFPAPQENVPVEATGMDIQVPVMAAGATATAVTA